MSVTHKPSSNHILVVPQQGGQLPNPPNPPSTPVARLIMDIGIDAQNRPIVTYPSGTKSTPYNVSITLGSDITWTSDPGSGHLTANLVFKLRCLNTNHTSIEMVTPGGDPGHSP